MENSHKFSVVNPEAGEEFRRYKFVRWDDSGNVVADVTFKDTLHQVSTAARASGLKLRKFVALFTKFKAGDERDAETPPVFRVRGINQKSVSGSTFTDFFEAAKYKTDMCDPVIEWDGIDVWCCLDVDFHSGGKPDEGELSRFASTVQPAPLAWWISRSGGLHAMYAASSLYSASELAALCGVRALARFYAATVELKDRTRLPKGFVRRFDQTVTVNQGLGSSSTDGAAWLKDADYVPGMRYQHERCPVNPSPRPSGNVSPVVVFDDHIYCYSCAAAGVRRGSATPGYFPLDALAGNWGVSLTGRCVDNFTHWGHAKHVIRSMIPQENLARLVYSAMLKRKHGNDDRIPLVFSAGLKTGLVRYDGYWAGDSGRVKPLTSKSAALCTLPVCLQKMDGEFRVNMSIVEDLASGDDLSVYGYTALAQIWGIHITQMQTPPVNRICSLLRRNGEPRFLSVASRMSEDDAWSVIERAYPGVDRNIIEMLVCAKGCTELRSGLSPMIFLTGPTGSGKTQSVNLAASICGDIASIVTFTPQEDRMRQGIMAAKMLGSFAFFDEYLKRAGASGMAPDTALEFILNLAPESMSHRLYVGPVPLGALPVCIWADTSVPTEVQSHAQLARRIHHAHITSGKAWNSDAKDLRRAGDEMCHAADSILSHIMDRHFLPPGPTDFADVAKMLNVPLLSCTDAMKHQKTLIQEFFRLVCDAPDPTDGELSASRLKGRGWKMIAVRSVGELAEAWAMLSDRSGASSRAIAEVDLREVLSLNEDAECDISRDRRGHVFIRFVNASRTRANRELLYSLT